MARDRAVLFKVSEAERSRLRVLADEAGLSVSEFVRRAALGSAEPGCAERVVLSAGQVAEVAERLPAPEVLVSTAEPVEDAAAARARLVVARNERAEELIRRGTPNHLARIQASREITAG